MSASVRIRAGKTGYSLTCDVCGPLVGLEISTEDEASLRQREHLVIAHGVAPPVERPTPLRPTPAIDGVSALVTLERPGLGRSQVSVPFHAPPAGWHLFCALTRQRWLEQTYGEHLPPLATIERVELVLDGAPRGAWLAGQDTYARRTLLATGERGAPARAQEVGPELAPRGQSTERLTDLVTLFEVSGAPCDRERLYEQVLRLPPYFSAVLSTALGRAVERDCLAYDGSEAATAVLRAAGRALILHGFAKPGWAEAAIGALAWTVCPECEAPAAERRLCERCHAPACGRCHDCAAPVSTGGGGHLS